MSSPNRIRSWYLMKKSRAVYGWRPSSSIRAEKSMITFGVVVEQPGDRGQVLRMVGHVRQDERRVCGWAAIIRFRCSSSSALGEMRAVEAPGRETPAA